MAKPPKTGPAKWVNHLMGDDPLKPVAWCGRKLAYRHRIAATVERVSCRKCRALIAAAERDEARQQSKVVRVDRPAGTRIV